MRFATLLFSILILIATAPADDKSAKPLTPAEAAKKVNEKVTVKMEVKSTGGNVNTYLNSEDDFKDDKNFAIMIPKDAHEKFKTAKIDDPKSYYMGKTIVVTGSVALNKERPQIKVEDPEQIKMIDKK